MDKSLEARRVFKATNSRMLGAINAAAEAGDTRLLEEIEFVMTVGAYEKLIAGGRYTSIKRKKDDRRSTERRTNDRRKSGNR